MDSYLATMTSLWAAALGPVAGAQTEAVTTEVVITAPVTEVWRAFTSPDQMRQWMVAHAEIDLRVGGKMLTHYDPAGAIGDPNTIENTILSMDPPRMLSIKATKAPQDFPFKAAIDSMWSVQYFDEISPQRTRVRCVGHGFGPDEESQKMRAFFEKGNEFTLQRLQHHFSGKTAEAVSPAGPDHRPAKPNGESSANPTVVEFSWLTGVWEGRIPAGRFEIFWAPIQGHHMMGMFRLFDDDTTLMLEFMSLAPADRGLEMRVRHFSPKLQAWEEKNDPITLRLIELDGDRSEFINDAHDRPKSVTITQQGPDQYRSVAQIVRDGKTETMDLLVRRKGSIQLSEDAP
jgi:uncharacterized protein YndB with AHSA1/START domain